MAGKKTIWFVSEVYHPDEQGTAFYTTGLAEGLARDFDVGVLCSFPTVTARGTRVPSKEVRNGVVVERCMGTTLDKDKIFLRLVNIFTCSAAILLKGLAKVRKGDLVIAVTAPPSMPFIAKIICLLTRAKCILRLEDVYPEIMVATGMIRANTPTDRILGVLNRLLYKSADKIVVLGRDMKALVERKIGGGNEHLAIIRCWSDTDIVRPVPKAKNALLKALGLKGKFIVSCIGNMGRAQAIELMLDAATLLQDEGRVHFLFIGSGAKKAWMEQEIARRGLDECQHSGSTPQERANRFPERLRHLDHFPVAGHYGRGSAEQALQHHGGRQTGHIGYRGGFRSVADRAGGEYRLGGAAGQTGASVPGRAGGPIRSGKVGADGRQGLCCGRRQVPTGADHRGVSCTGRWSLDNCSVCG